jgi:hypothetical protein
MPYQGTAHIHDSKAAEKAIDLQAGAAQLLRFVKHFVGDHMHIRSHPQIT